MTTFLIIAVAIGVFCFSVLWLSILAKALQWIYKKSQDKHTGGK